MPSNAVSEKAILIECRQEASEFGAGYSRLDSSEESHFLNLMMELTTASESKQQSGHGEPHIA